MTLLYTSAEEAKHQILMVIQKQTIEPVLIAQTEPEIIAFSRKYRPKHLFLFMPGMAGAAVEIQEYIRQFLPHCRIRILPSQRPTTRLLGGWEKVVAKAFRKRSKLKKKAVKL